MSDHDPKAALMAGAWMSFILWAATETEILERYKQETGRTYPPPAARNGLDAMIDAATGFQGTAAEEFAAWVTETMWGLDEAPPAFQARVVELKKLRHDS